MKAYIIFIFLSIFCSAQKYTLDKTKEFVYPELKIESPIDHLKMFRFFRNYEPENYKIKSRFLDNILTEYDINGNIVSETSKDFNLYQKKTNFKYNNGILIEKITTSKADKEKIKRKNEESEREAKRDIKKNRIATVANFDAEDTESIYSAELDKKNRIISTKYENYKISNGEKQLSNEISTQIEYSGNKIKKIISGNSKNFYEVNYFYDGNILTKTESLNGGTNVYQQRKKTQNYTYDKQKNLVAIYEIQQYYINGKTNDSNKPRLIDSANYDNKNRIIWHGNKYRYETFKYDKNNNVVEYTKFDKDKSGETLKMKQEYEYDNKNNIIKYSENDNRFSSPHFTAQNFTYVNGLLKQTQNSSEKFPIGAKTVYEYNDKNLLIKKSEYIPTRFKDKNAPENQFELREVTRYIYGDKTLIIKGENGTIAEYVFY